MFVPVRPVDEKLLPVMTMSASGTYIVQYSWRDGNRRDENNTVGIIEIKVTII